MKTKEDYIIFCDFISLLMYFDDQSICRHFSIVPVLGKMIIRPITKFTKFLTFHKKATSLTTSKKDLN